MHGFIISKRRRGIAFGKITYVLKFRVNAEKRHLNDSMREWILRSRHEKCHE
jgi:hypothetical protein